MGRSLRRSGEFMVRASFFLMLLVLLVASAGAAAQSVPGTMDHHLQAVCDAVAMPTSPTPALPPPADEAADAVLAIGATVAPLVLAAAEASVAALRHACKVAGHAAGAFTQALWDTIEQLVASLCVLQLAPCDPPFPPSATDIRSMAEEMLGAGCPSLVCGSLPWAILSAIVDAFEEICERFAGLSACQTGLPPS